MKKRKKSAERLFGDLGAACQLLASGLVHSLYPVGQTPDSVKSRSYCHVADDYKLYLVGERYLLEFREQCNVDVVYRALFLESHPDVKKIGELFTKHLRLYGNGGYVYVMTDFDQLAALSDSQNESRDDEEGLKAILTFFGLAFTGIAMLQTQNGEGEPTPFLSRVGLAMIGTGFLYLRKRFFH